MGFQIIDNRSHGRNVASGVAIGTCVAGRNLKVRIRFAPDVIEVMGWKNGAKLEIAYGDSKDVGKLRIGLNELCGFKLRSGGPNNRSKTIHCNQIGNGTKQKSQHVEHKIKNGYLYIELPEWARSKAT